MCERARTFGEGVCLCCVVGIYFLPLCAFFYKAGGLCCLVPTTAEPNINLQKSLAVSGLRANPKRTAAGAARPRDARGAEARVGDALRHRST